MTTLFDATARANPAGYKDVVPGDVSVPAQGYAIIDVREPDEYVGELGHIPGAKLVPMASLLAQAATWEKNVEYLVVCKAGGRSANSAQALVRAGFSKVMNLAGGMLAWNAAGLKVER
jgi:rhodanese-related sulfurtransferase